MPPESEQPKATPSWPHAPLHRLSESGTFIVTAGTYQKQHFFRGKDRLEFLQFTLLETLAKFDWQLEAWAVFSNHYHFVAHSPQAAPGASSLAKAIQELHSKTAKWVNQQDCQPGRKVWHNYWDTSLTIEKSYLARLNYVHQNAVHHGLVEVASEYPHCSARWFEQTARPAQVNTIYSFKTDQLKVQDEFHPAPEF